MATKRVKGRCGGKVVKKCHTRSEDQISQLPDSLIHHIFSFIPTINLVRTSILSKRWRYTWVSTPYLYFDDLDNITFNKKVKKQNMVLIKFVSQFLKHRELWIQIPDIFITSFKFNTCYGYASNVGITKRIDGWLNFVVQSKAKELDLCVRNYCLSRFVLNASSLTVLKLSSLKLEASFLSTFPSLKVLSLRNVEFDNKSLQNLISGCPIMEELHLSSGGDDSLGGYIDFDVSGTLRNLSLSCIEFTNQWLDNLVYGLPLLERLTLDGYELEKTTISSHSLKYISSESLHCIEVALTTPNLVCLHLTCVSWLNISVEASNLLEVNLSLDDRSMDNISYMDLISLLSNLNFAEKMMLTVWIEEVLIFPKGIRKQFLSPLPKLRHLKVKVRYSRSQNGELRNSLLWCAPSLKTLEIIRDNERQ